MNPRMSRRDCLGALAAGAGGLLLPVPAGKPTTIFNGRCGQASCAAASAGSS